MGAADTLIEEILVSTGFFGGVWTAVELHPNVVLVEALGQILISLGDSGFAASYVASMKALITISFFAGVAGSYAIGGKLGFAGFWCLYLAGALILSWTAAAIWLMILGYLFGLLAVELHTDQSVQPAAPI